MPLWKIIFFAGRGAQLAKDIKDGKATINNNESCLVSFIQIAATGIILILATAYFMYLSIKFFFHMFGA